MNVLAKAVDPLYLYFFMMAAVSWLLVLSLVLVSFLRRYEKLTRDVTSSDLKEIWIKHLESLSRAQERVENIEQSVVSIQEMDKKHFQKFGFIRFNPFSDSGGNQSFVITLLNGLGDGVIFSSLHGREGTRLYGKSVKGFKGDGFELSKEEVEAVSYAARS